MAGIFISCFPIFSPNMSGISDYCSDVSITVSRTIGQSRSGLLIICGWFPARYTVTCYTILNKAGYQFNLILIEIARV